MKALLLDNDVVDVAQEAFLVASPLYWMDAPNECQVGWILNNGVLEPKPEPVPTQEETLNEYKNAMQRHLDAKASERDYDNGFACASYANSTNATWQQEATDFIAWRDNCWTYAIDVEDQVLAGTMSEPTLDSFIADAPVLTWSA